MNNKEKKEYINLKSVSIWPYMFVHELSKKSFILNNTPRTLYKFRKFDEYTIDMIKNNYVYLAKASTLDDPFDCLTFPDSILDFNSTNLELTPERLNYLSNMISRPLPLMNALNAKDLTKIIKQSLINGKVDESLIRKEVLKRNDIDEKEKWRIINTFDYLNSLSIDAKQDEKLEEHINYFINAKQNFGVCSLTTKRDNKPMWSLYGDVYKGYCIEYDIPIIDDVINNIFPVIYKTKYDNSVYKAFFKTLYGQVERQLTNGHRNGGVAALIELLCTKDRDWAYQDEWRLIGTEGFKFYELKIKNIYLGFDVSENNEKKILSASKDYDYKVYKMNEPKGSNKISYKLL